MEFAAEGPTAILGVYADEKSGLLWVCYADPAAFSGQAFKGSILRTYNLSDGALKTAYPMGDGSLCNDIATVADHWPTSRRDLIAKGKDPNDPNHGRGLCASCHGRETAAHQPGGWNYR